MGYSEDRNQQHSNGYITVLFAMILLTVISLILSAIESVRVSAVRARAEMSCAIACEAFLSQYQPQVQARYGLFLLERDGYDDLFLKKFIGNNCKSNEQLQQKGVHWTDAGLSSVSIIDERSVSDENFKYLEAQICDYMKIAKGTEYVKTLIQKLTDVSVQELDQKKNLLTDDLSNTGSRSDAQKEAAEAEANAQKQNQNNKDQNGQSSSTQNKPATESEGPKVEDPRKNLTQILRYPILTLMMGGNLSNAVLDTASLSDVVPAEKNVSQMKGFLQYKDVTGNLQNSDLNIVSQIKSQGDLLLVDSYIIDYLKNASKPGKKSGTCFNADTTANTDGHTMNSGSGRTALNGDSALQYEVEYILSGNARDARNLENTVNRLALIRMLLNLTYLYKNSTRLTLVRTVATALAASFLMPFLEEIFYLLILAAWAYAEALVDCKQLLSGGKVPLMKTDSTWNLSLNQLIHLQTSELDGNTGQSSEQRGLSYEDYLHLLLLGVSREKKYTRLLNIIEANIHLEEGGESFLAGQSVLGITICADFTFPPLFAINPFSNGQYEHHVLKSCAY